MNDDDLDEFIDLPGLTLVDDAFDPLEFLLERLNQPAKPRTDARGILGEEEERPSGLLNYGVR